MISVIVCFRYQLINTRKRSLQAGELVLAVRRIDGSLDPGDGSCGGITGVTGQGQATVTPDES